MQFHPDKSIGRVLFIGNSSASKKLSANFKKLNCYKEL